MYAIVKKEVLAPQVKLFIMDAPDIASKALAGQFVILRIDDKGERIPLTIADYDRQQGTLTLIFQEVGKSTIQLGALGQGEAIADLVGPLGRPSEIHRYGAVVCVGGGIGTAPIYPIARALREAGNTIISIIGAKTKGLVFWEDKLRQVSAELFVTTDDGSYGRSGFVTDQLKDIITRGPVDRVFAIGPVVMMRAVCQLTAPLKLATIVSLNPIMVDGTGMCGGCRVTVGGKTKFACVDGPEFDGHQVNFSELMNRQRTYIEHEKCALTQVRKTWQK